MTDLRLVVFDVDGTLIDSQDAIVTSVGHAFAALGRPVPDRATVLSIVGLSLPQAMARLMPDLTEAGVQDAIAAYRARILELRAEAEGEGHAPLYPGARDALDRLHRRDELFLGVATGKARRGLDHAFASHGIGHYFHTCQTADHHPSKPHPSMLHQACDDIGIEPGQAIMLGDTSFDMEMGRAAGCRTIGVSWGYHPVADLRAAGADCVIDSFAALDAALEAVWGMADE
ncbi:HAD-IA family hydrolase [Actibacterium ureilyticum]|uniref:HAD-IA family hydrolase n=1 Tax=Actibacterium ureilyticum TaxID=1590614 RepID=UPI000BAAFE5F|nr:HAD-IA family hydrolase [Actibacterium ureilyticum]